jgi:hypothetical protein
MALDLDLSDGITSGADTTQWDPIDIDQDGKKDEDEDASIKLEEAKSNDSGVTSGGDSNGWNASGEQKPSKPK